MDLKEKRGLDRGNWQSTQGKLQTISSPELLAGARDDCKWMVCTTG